MKWTKVEAGIYKNDQGFTVWKSLWCNGWIICRVGETFPVGFSKTLKDAKVQVERKE